MNLVSFSGCFWVQRQHHWVNIVMQVTRSTHAIWIVVVQVMCPVLFEWLRITVCWWQGQSPHTAVAQHDCIHSCLICNMLPLQPATMSLETSLMRNHSTPLAPFAIGTSKSSDSVVWVIRSVLQIIYFAFRSICLTQNPFLCNGWNATCVLRWLLLQASHHLTVPLRMQVE